MVGQKLSLQKLMEHFRERWSRLPDQRKANPRLKYTLADGVLAAFSVFFMQSRSFLAHQRLLQSKQGRNNARSLFQVQEIPSDPQIRNLLDGLDHRLFAEDFWYVLEELRQQQQWVRFRSALQTYTVVLDGVNFFSSEKISCAKCLKRRDGAGKEHFYHAALTPVLVKAGQSQVLPLPPEFLTAQDGQEKQDCERNAAKRWLERHAAHFSAGSVTYVGDDLYANQPLCQRIAETYQQYFIFVCKPDSHEGLYQWVEFLEKNNAVETLSERRWNGKRGEVWRYRFVSEVPLRNGEDAFRVNWFEVVVSDEKTGEVLYRNSFITNHVVTAANVADLVEVGRARWKIENENNNPLKRQGYHFEHNFGHGRQDLSNVLASLNLLAFLLHTVQELLIPPYQRLRAALGARKTFFEDLRALTRYIVFDSWEDLFAFMEEGLELAPLPP